MQRPLSLKPRPLKFWLLLLVAAVVLPLSTLTAFVVWQAGESIRVRTGDQLLHRSRADALAVDAEFQRIETGLRVLAASTALAGGDLGAVEAEMRSLSRQIGGAPIALATADGREILDTRWPPGEARPHAALRPGLLSLVASRRTEIDNLSPLPASGRPTVTVVVPVEAPRPGPALSFLAGLPEGRLAALLSAAGSRDGATVTVADRTGTIAARTRDEAAFLGRPIGLRIEGDGREGVLHVGAAGAGGRAAESLAYAQAPRSGYTVVVAVPQAVFNAPLGNAVKRVAALAGVFLLVGGGLAAVLARRFRGELHRATVAGPSATSVLREADELGRSVAEAAAAQARATAGLAASEHRFRALAEAGALAIWRSDAAGGMLEGRGWSALTGQTKDEIRGTGWLAAVHPDDRAPAIGAWSAARAAMQPAAVEFRVRTAPGGQWRWVRGRGVPVSGKDGGGVAEWVGVVEDIHGRKQAEQAVAEREARLRLAVEAGNLGSWEYDILADQGMRVGAPGETLMSPGPDGFRLENWLRQLHPEDRAAMETAFRDMKSGATARYAAEFRVRRRPPAEGWAWVASAGAVVERDADTGAPLRIAGISRDVSEQREAEARRLLLAREVDHRAKNLLAVVQSVLRLTPRDRPEEFAAAVERRVAALARAHNLLAERGWSAADLGAVATRELAGLPPGTVLLDGPPVALAAAAVQPVAMALHELATNAAKHGALSRPEGRVALRWGMDADAATLRITWAESGGPPVSAPPSRRGFGSRMIQATLEGQLRGALSLHWEEEGLRAEIALPAARVLAAAAAAEPAAEKRDLVLALGK